jgi:thiol-disulfide isomerase/thioredoxin
MLTAIIAALSLGYQLAPMPTVPLRNLALKDVKGFPRPLYGKGSGTVLFFVATDCPIANRYAPELGRIVRDYGPKGVSFIFVYVDPSQTSAQVGGHLKEYKLQAPGVLDLKHQIVKAAGATVTPEAVVLARNGKMVYRGRIDDLFLEHGRAKATAKNQDLRNALNQFLAGKPVKVPQTPALGCSIPPLD